MEYRFAYDQDSGDPIAILPKWVFDQLLQAKGHLLGIIDGNEDEECWYDHHGYCQGHSMHDAPCPYGAAAKYVREIMEADGTPDA